MLFNSRYIVWEEQDATGVAIIDEQHRSMVSTINTLFFFINHGKAEQYFKPLLKMLEMQCILHFAIEESMMVQTNFPGYGVHAEQHEEMLEGIRDMLYEVVTQDDPLDALKYLKHWWKHHIRGEDLTFIDYFITHTQFTKVWDAV